MVSFHYLIQVWQNKEEAMDMEKLQEFFFWCMLVNTGIYAFTAIAVLVLRDLVYKIHRKMFGLDEETVSKSMYVFKVFRTELVVS